MSKFSQRIKLIREQQKLSSVAFAEKLGVKSHQIQGVEYGRQKASHELLAKITEVFAVNINWLLTGEGELYLEKEQDKIHPVAKLITEWAMQYTDTHSDSENHQLKAQMATSHPEFAQFLYDKGVKISAVWTDPEINKIYNMLSPSAQKEFKMQIDIISARKREDYLK